MIDVSKKKRIVLKLGTSTLTHKTGKLNIRRMTNLVRILSDLHNEGRELLLVSSGIEFGQYQQARDEILHQLEEIRQGRKRSHWIWYIFPQLKGLGRSYNSEYYGIASLEEAKEYLGDAVLRGRLQEISKALMEHKEEDIHSIMGGIDAQKLRSSMTLFESAAGDDDGCKVFGEILDTFFDGKRDGRTLGMLKAQEK